MLWKQQLTCVAPLLILPDYVGATVGQHIIVSTISKLVFCCLLFASSNYYHIGGVIISL